MKYPWKYSFNDEPEEIRVGDLIWWNEGICIGFVEDVIEKREVFESWGLREPGIVVTNLHPFEANKKKHKQQIGSVSCGGSVLYSASDLEDEGIGLLSPHEQSEFQWAISKAKSDVSPAHRDSPFCVMVVMDLDRREEDWHFHFVDEECEVLEAVVFPSRPDTRTKLNPA